MSYTKKTLCIMQYYNSNVQFWENPQVWY